MPGSDIFGVRHRFRREARLILTLLDLYARGDTAWWWDLELLRPFVVAPGGDNPTSGGEEPPRW